MDLDERRKGGESGREWETIIRIYCMKKSIFNLKINFKNLSVRVQCSQRLKKGIGSPRNGATDLLTCYVGAEPEFSGRTDSTLNQ